MGTASPTDAAMPGWHALCGSPDLQDSGLAVPFDVVYGGQTCRAFAIRFQGQVRAYINRCSHVAMEMDSQIMTLVYPVLTKRLLFLVLTFMPLEK